MDDLADAVRDFLSALDKGYFDSRLTTGGVESAFVKDLRKQLAIHEAQSTPLPVRKHEARAS